MIVFLDDLRDPPNPTWVRTFTVHSTIRLLETGEVETLSLDHDLGDKADGHGIDVLNWLEHELFANNNWDVLPSRILIHSQNPVGRENMERALESIYRKLRMHRRKRDF